MSQRDAAYMREYRRKNPAKVREASARQHARVNAALTVAERYPNLWEAAYVAECEARGVDPYPPIGRPRANGRRK